MSAERATFSLGSFAGRLAAGHPGERIVRAAMQDVAMGHNRKSVGYSITSSARAITLEKARPSAFAVLRLTASSNCVGCSIGKSGRHHDKTGAWELHTDLSDRGIAASDDDLMDARGDQL